ncbi:MAG: PaaX family transcriptional regulator [Austwickia sp.]|nr:PaaX family transcriptional regulator [Austwickia sp.]MBK8435989.1 PaaX family transcriptional regulator [Austwickia sp.]MBK9101668.1 PaaX family transcriptional regulator [Austwickia sp.]
MQARSALFDVYGDHVTRAGGWAPVAGLVKALSALGIAPPATRTAVSRMAREGWLEPVELGGQRGYSATAVARRHLQEAHRRIYRSQRAQWDGTWDVVTISHHGSRASRNRLVASLGYLGYAALAPGVWVAPRRSAELAERLGAEHAQWHAFTGTFDGVDHDLAARLWDLESLADQYRAFTGRLAADRELLEAGVSAQEAFVMRSRTVHQWRKFLFLDPGLPAAVLPADWPGEEAAHRFAETAAHLRRPAEVFLEECLAPHPHSSPPPRHPHAAPASRSGAPLNHHSQGVVPS